MGGRLLRQLPLHRADVPYRPLAVPIPRTPDCLLGHLLLYRRMRICGWPRSGRLGGLSGPLSTASSHGQAADVADNNSGELSNWRILVYED